MAIDAKVSLQQQIENKLMTEVTADTMNRMLRIVADVLEGFDVREIAPEEEQDDLLDCYLNAMRVQGRSEKTLHRYKYIIEKMMKEVGVSTRRITVYHLRNYLAAMKAAGRQDSTMEGERQIFSAYFNWLQRESLIDRNPTANLGAIKCPKKQKKIFTDIDMEKLRQGCKSKRDRAIIAFLASTGCRVSELSNPPFSKRQEILEKLYYKRIPFALIMNFNGLFDSRKRFDLFRENNVELLVPSSRIHFFNDSCNGNSPNFQSVYVCNGILEKQIEFAEIDKFSETDLQLPGQIEMDFEVERAT